MEAFQGSWLLHSRTNRQTPEHASKGPHAGQVAIPYGTDIQEQAFLSSWLLVIGLGSFVAGPAGIRKLGAKRPGSSM